MVVRPERVWHRTPEALRREIAEDVAALLAEGIHENGTDRRPPPRTARGDLHPPVHATPGADQPGELAPTIRAAPARPRPRLGRDGHPGHRHRSRLEWGHGHAP